MPISLQISIFLQRVAEERKKEREREHTTTNTNELQLYLLYNKNFTITKPHNFALR